MGKLLDLSGPIQVSCIQVFPGHPDDPAVIKPMVMPKQQVLPFPGKSCLLYDYSCCGSWLFVYGEYTFCVFVGLKRS